MDSIIKKDKENNSFMLEVILLKWSIIFLLYLGANVVQVTGMINIIPNIGTLRNSSFAIFVLLPLFLFSIKKGIKQRRQDLISIIILLSICIYNTCTDRDANWGATITSLFMPFMYPLAVAVTMAVFFREKKSIVTFAAIVLSLVGASLLSSGNIEYNGGNRMVGLIAACISVFSYAGYIIGIRKTRAVEVNSTVLTCYVMGLGALLFLLGGLFYDKGVRWETNVITWLYIGGLALPATAISNITLVKAVKLAGPTLTSLLGALEPLTAVLVGVFVFNELFTTYSALGIILVVISVSLVLFQQKRTYT